MFSFCSLNQREKGQSKKTDKRNTLTPKSNENINHDILESDKGGISWGEDRQGATVVTLF